MKASELMHLERRALRVVVEAERSVTAADVSAILDRIHLPVACALARLARLGFLIGIAAPGEAIFYPTVSGRVLHARLNR